MFIQFSGGLGADDDFALARLNPGGSLDATFRGDGKLVIGFCEAASRKVMHLPASDGRASICLQVRPIASQAEMISLLRACRHKQ